MVTMIVDGGSGGHRHVHTRLLTEELQDKIGLDLTSVLFLLSSSTVCSTLQALSPERRPGFQSRVLPAPPNCSASAFYRIVGELAREHGVTDVIFLDLDSVLYHLCWRPPKFRFSGVWFRPNFHYSGSQLMHESWRQRALAFVKRLVARRLCRLPTLEQIIVFDKWAAEYARSVFNTAKVEYIPDPVGFDSLLHGPVCKGSAGAKTRLLIVGEVSERKGVLVALKALTQLDPAHQRRLELRIVGKCVAKQRAAIMESIEKHRHTTSATISVLDDFVSDQQIDQELAYSDTVLLLYTNFIGSSGILIRASLLQRPVIASQFGLLGSLVRQYKLGRVVNPWRSEEVASAFLDAMKGTKPFDSCSAAQFAAEHRPEIYTQHLANLSTCRSDSKNGVAIS